MTQKIPFYANFALKAIAIFALVYTLYIGQTIIVPLLYSLVIAILVNPIVNFLINKRVPKIVAIAITVVLFILFILLFFYIISTQISIFSESYPQLRDKFNIMTEDFLQFISQQFNIPHAKIDAFIIDSENQFINNFSFQDKLTVVCSLLISITLVPVYLFMILYYKPLLLEFVHQVFKTKYSIPVQEVLVSIKRIIQSYLVGLFFEMIIIAILNSIALLIIGIDYAIILGVLGAVINVIPYLGGIVSISLPMIIAFVTKDSLSYTVIVFCVYILIQFIDNHFIIPKIVASRVKINALISIIAVLVGNAIWGVAGMFISIPLIAILKVVFDHIEHLKPWGYLLGNSVQTGFKPVSVPQSL
jgi:predicted PurR-regulated permease PerM